MVFQKSRVSKGINGLYEPRSAQAATVALEEWIQAQDKMCHFPVEGNMLLRKAVSLIYVPAQ